jgi:hypothetical protein
MKEESHHKGHVFKAYLFDELSSDEATSPKRKSKPDSPKSLEECDIQGMVKRGPSEGVKQ